ncbi:MAG: hypothetical protein GY793_11395 [Proteobacteria bacterium]|nr:hypothetical protein [Pseudomonadota bacterium]
MDKRKAFEILQNRVEKLIEEIEISRNEAQGSANEHVGAMESRYDTFKEEAQYLAAGYTKRLMEFKDIYKKLEQILNTTSILEQSHNKVAIASIVMVSDENEQTYTYLISPVMGGENLLIDNKEISVITPSTPLGIKLMNKQIDDAITITLRGKQQELVIEDIL